MGEERHRLEWLETRAALQDLAARYFLAADSDDEVTTGACFTPDAQFSVSGQVCATSRADIVAFINAERAKMGLTVHTFNSALVEATGPDTAKGVVTAHIEMVYDGTPIYGAVRYHDEFRRIEGVWMIHRLDLRTVFMAPWLGGSDALLSDKPVRWPGTDPQPSDFPRKRKQR